CAYRYHPGAESLAEILPQLSGLRGLDLGRTAITAQGVRTLASALLNSRVKFLGLNGNPIGIAGVRALAEMLKVNRTLVKWHVSSTVLPLAQVEEVFSELPDLDYFSGSWIRSDDIDASGVPSAKESGLEPAPAVESKS